ncbi:unnamed protein product [Caenorhabditis angaria]|uniref:Uncharacterized protein n=1 Tax=Caenorhabditis angaria TaxID=860376 RepID=A0A9P1MUB8_9PELO|nr:unnamed protein product [Caenorhabditis angaria]
MSSPVSTRRASRGGRGAKRTRTGGNDDLGDISLTDELIETVNELKNKVKKIEENMENIKMDNKLLQDENKKLKSMVLDFTSKMEADKTQNSPTQLYSEVSIQQLNDKSTIAVVENFPDSKGSDQDLTDSSTIERICKASAITIPTRTFRVKVSKPENLTSRPLKVCFNKTEDRNLFLSKFRSSTKELGITGVEGRTLRVRRDMTIDELTVLRHARKTAYDKNKELGKFKFYVRDLEIKELETPKDLLNKDNVDNQMDIEEPTSSKSESDKQ